MSPSALRPLRPPRLAIDTNLVLSALVFRGAAAALRKAWQEGACDPLVNAATTEELIRVLAYPKFRLSPDEQFELLADYLPFATTVRMPATLPVVPACRDPFDLPFLQLAIAGKAAALVSGDQDLLVLSGKMPVPVLSLKACLERLARRAKG